MTRREQMIIFRGKRIDNGEWVCGFIVKMFGTYHIIDKDDENTAYEVIPSTVGQYTGLKDKNGKRIFEGDILGSRYDYLSPDNVAVEVVKWFCNSWVIQEGDRPPMLLEEDEILPYSEVVGNVHDNPELLKKVVENMRLLVNEKCPEFKDYLVPMCEYAGCHEFQVCQNPPKPR